MSSNRNAYLSIIESTPFLELMPEIEIGKKYRVFFKDEDSKQIALAISKIHSQVVVLLKKIENEKGNNFFTLNPNRKFKKEQALREISHATISCSSKYPNIENIIEPNDLKNIKDIQGSRYLVKDLVHP